MGCLTVIRTPALHLLAGEYARDHSKLEADLAWLTGRLAEAYHDAAWFSPGNPGVSQCCRGASANKLRDPISRTLRTDPPLLR